MQLHFGFDLDNTLINYDSSALAYSKLIGIPDQNSINQLRTYFTSSGQPESWTKAQSWIYAHGLELAEISSGAIPAINRLLSNGYGVSIISHKTKFGPSEFGSVPLRAVAIDWIARSQLNAYFPNLNNIYFADSIEEKVIIIRNCNLSHYADDLLKIFTHVEYPKNKIKSYLYKPTCEFPNWINPLNNFDSLIYQNL
jgi:hypothetical protein